MGEREELRQNLETLNLSLAFLLLIVFSVLLSLWSALIQREQLGQALAGEGFRRTPDPNSIRQQASSIMVGCLGFFLCLALQTRGRAQGEGDPVTRRSAQVNVWASLLVLLAAILRLVDLQAVAGEAETPLLEETTLPD